MRAPVAIFVYNRLKNTQSTLEHLCRNTLAGETDVYVFSDGGKDSSSWAAVHQVRDYVRKLKSDAETSGTLKSLTLVERPENIYLERNIIEGIQEVLGKHDRIIVLEDDICTSPYYLEYMNDALDKYEDEEKVMHVSGFTNLDLENNKSIIGGNDIYFTPHMSGWGWGTWRSRWTSHFQHYKTKAEALKGMSSEDMSKMQYGGVFPCLKSLDKDPIPWDICWEIAIYKAHGLCLTPLHTMVRNIGLRQGTHFRSFTLLQRYEFDREPLQRRINVPKVEHPTVNEEIEQLFAQAIRDWGIRYTLLGKILRFLYKCAKRCKTGVFAITILTTL